MKNLVITLLLFALSSIAKSQPYFPVERGKTSYFTTQSGTIYLKLKDSSLSFPKTYTCEKQLLYAPDELQYWGTLHQLYTVLGKSFQWYADSQVVFYNYLNKSITLKLNSTINEQWLAYADSNVTVYIKHIKDSILAIDDVIDSVKHFKCIVQTLRIPPFPASNYGDFIDISISKNHGIINAPDFYHFPLLSSESYFNSIGAHLYFIRYNTAHMDKVHNITWDSIYRFNIGDEFHSQQLNRYNKQFIGTVYDSLNEIIEVTNAQYKTDTFIYTIRHTQIGKISTELGDSNWHNVETKDVRYYHSNFIYLDTEPGIIYIPSSSLFTVYSSNGTIAKSQVARTNLYYQNDSTISTTDVSVIDRPVFIKGCGGPYFQDKSIIRHPLIQGITIKELVFYKKRNLTWGTPLSKIVGLKNEQTLRHQLFPNPSQNEITLTLPQAGNATLQFYGVSGLLMKEVVLTEQQNFVSTQDLPAGIYFYRLKQHEQTAFGKLVKQ